MIESQPSFFNDAGLDQEYEPGQAIELELDFGESVTVDTSGGTPRLAVAVGVNTRYATYSSAKSATSSVVFVYTVAADDSDRDGVAVPRNALDLNGGAIHREGDATAPARITHPARPANSAYRVTNAGFAAVFSQLQRTHNGSSEFEVRVRFNLDLGSLAHLTDGMTVAGATVTEAVSRVHPSISDRQRNLQFKFKLTPSGDGNVTITLPVPAECTANSHICSVADRPLARALVGRVLGPNMTERQAVSIAARTSSVTEGSDAEYRLSYSGATTTVLLVVTVSLSESGDAISGSDRTAEVTFAANGAKNATLNVATDDDSAYENDSEVTATVTAAADALYTVGPDAAATVTVQDNDEPLPAVTIEAGTSPVTEGTGAEFTLRRSGVAAAIARALTVNVQWSESGDVLAGSERMAEVTFDAHDLSATLTLATDDDPFDENDSEVTATVTAAADAPYTVGSPASAMVTVEDDDDPVEVGFAATSYSVTEGFTVEVAVELGAAPGLEVTIPLVRANQGGATDADLIGVPESVTFASDQTSASLSLRAIHDTDTDAGESVELSLGTLPSGFVGETGATSTTVSIANNPASRFTAEFAPLPGQHNGSAAFEVRVRFSADLGASAHLRDGMVIAGGTRGTVSRVSSGDDTLWKFNVTPSGDEDVQITLPVPAACDDNDQICSSADVPLAEKLAGRVLGPVSLSEVTIDAQSDTVTEGADAVFTLTRTGVTETELSVTVSVAESGDVLSDSVTSTQVAFGAGVTTATLTLGTDDDSVDEDHGRVTATIAEGSGYLVGTDSSATVTVFDDEATIEFTLLPGAQQVPSDWNLIPSGASVDDEFRLLIFTEESTQGGNGNISHYDDIVQDDVGSGHTAIRPYSSDFRVLGCTSSTDANDHTSTTHSSSNPGVPIYWLNGDKVADDYRDFYDGAWDSNRPRYPSGDTAPTGYAAVNVFTGCDSDGEKRSHHANRLGGTQPMTGFPDTNGREIRGIP